MRVRNVFEKRVKNRSEKERGEDQREDRVNQEAREKGEEKAEAASGVMAPAIAGARQRRERSDKGKVTITPRDAVVLTWLGAQYAVRLDQLQVLLGRRAQAPTQADGLVSADTARRVVTRWAKAGWVEHRRVFHRQPEWVWLTRAGMQLAGLEYFAGQPSPVMLNHYRQVNRVRLSVEERHPAAGWTCERALKPQRQRQRDRDTHYADAEIRIGEATVGLEVELSVKKAAQLTAIVAGLAREYRTVWYFVEPVKPNVLPGVRQAIGYLPPAEQRRFKLYSIETLTEIAT